MDFSDHNDAEKQADAIRTAEAAAQRAAEVEDGEKNRAGRDAGGDMGNPADADLSANIRPDVVAAPGGLVTITTAKSATYHPEPSTPEHAAAAHEVRYLNEWTNAPHDDDPAANEAWAAATTRLAELDRRAELVNPDEARGQMFLDRLDDRIANTPEGDRGRLENLRISIGETHPDIGGDEHPAAIGQDIREGTGFAAWRETHELVGDLLPAADVERTMFREHHDEWSAGLSAAEYVAGRLADADAFDAEAASRHNEHQNESAKSAEATDGAPRDETMSAADYVASRLNDAKASTADRDEKEAINEVEAAAQNARGSEGPDIF